MNAAHTAQIKKAELLSSIGAGVLGAGIALLFAKIIAPFAIPILLLGLASHSAGMFRKHRLEQQSENVRIWWVEALYWFCWLALAALLIYIVIRQF
ncbi:MAG: hypothetical protein DCC59_06285 [Chloroflexi bacterium]|jgi:hypothetical protein|nr:MAG: hypothetical protein DCC59_06285 [Chloroflexota bacterium]